MVKSCTNPAPFMIRYRAKARITEVRPTPMVMPVLAPI
jgi:hypothetical protein